MKLVVVESPAKANTVEKYLGQGYRVLASKGHIRDLLETDGSVDPNSDFLMRWRTNPDRAQELDAIAKAVKDADGLILATDPDREGEAISWHVLEVLQAEARTQGQAGQPRRLQRHHQAVRARCDGQSARDRPRRWSTPISPAARSTISSASRCRRCCGASCPAPARPAACSRWRCASSATARPRSSASSARNTGRSPPSSRRRATKASRRG